MTVIKFTISDDIIERMKKYPEIDWENVAKNAVKKYLEKLEIADRLLSKSTLTLDEAENLSEEIKQKMWEKHKLYLENLEQ